MKRLLAVLFAVLVLTVAPTTATAIAARPSPPAPITRISVYQTPSAASLPVSAAVTNWSKAKNIDLVLVTSPCSGKNCVIVTQGTDYSLCGGGLICYDGYAYPQADGSCIAFLETWATAPAFETPHEIGHCIGLPHNFTDSRSVMQPTANPRVTAPDSQDLRNLAALYSAPAS